MSHAELHRCAQYARVRMARDGGEWTFMMSLYVLGHFFGDEWVEKNLFTQSFLKPPSRFTDREKQLQVGLSGYQLAETLFNLQDLDGFQSIHSRLLTGELEPCIGELEAASFLKRHGEKVRFIIPEGLLGENYDLEMSRDAVTICCEVKIKLEAAALTEKGLYNSLEHARKQLPKNKPGLIFLRVVGNKTNSELQAKANLVQPAIRRLFRQTRRIIGVVLLTRMYEHMEDQTTAWNLWRTIPNLKSDYSMLLLDNFPNEDVNVDRKSPLWTYLNKYYPRFIQDIF